MKYLSILLILSSYNCFAQNCTQNNIIDKNELIGIWQADTTEESDAWLDVYRFFENGEFIFNPNQYDGLKRILAINGKYRIVGNNLYLKVSSTTEIVGGHLVRSTIETLSDSWAIEGGQIKKFEQPNKDEEVIEISQHKNTNSKDSFIMLDNRKYYKMRNDPTKYY